jgi:hypothetical protein
MGLSQREEERYCPEFCVDLAIMQMADQGFLRTEDMEDLLSDGSHNYRTMLTTKGKEHLQRNAKIRFVGCDL